MTTNRLARFTALSATSAALAFGGVGIAQASHGADDPPGHDANDDHGGEHLGGKDDHGHHGPNHD